MMPRSAKPPSTPLIEDHLGFWLRFVSNHVSGRFKRLLEAKGTTVTEWVALRTLYDKPETTHAELIDVLGMTKGAASKVISKLEEKGLAQRWLAEGSGREQVLTLTAAGRALVPTLAAEADRNEQHFFGHMSAEERQVLKLTLQGLVTHHQLKQVPVS